MPSIPGGSLLRPQPRIESVTQAVAKEVEGQHGGQDRESGKESEPGRVAAHLRQLVYRQQNRAVTRL